MSNENALPERVWRHPPGFRFSTTDAVTIVVTVAATVWLWDLLGRMALLFPIVLGHFFLFCNVFRVRRKYELIWAALFLANASMWWMLGDVNWWGVLAVQAPATISCIVAEVRSPEYHGVAFRTLRQPRAAGE